MSIQQFHCVYCGKPTQISWNCCMHCGKPLEMQITKIIDLTAPPTIKTKQLNNNEGIKDIIKNLMQSEKQQLSSPTITKRYNKYVPLLFYCSLCSSS